MSPILLTLFLLCAFIQLATSGRISPILEERISRLKSTSREATKRGHETLPVLISFDKQVSTQGYYRINDVDLRARSIVKDKQQIAHLSQKPILDHLEKNGFKYSSFWIENVIEVGDATVDLIQWLQEREDVDVIKSDHHFKAELGFNAESEKDKDDKVVDTTHPNIEWGVNFIKAPQVWEKGFKGQNITVGIADTGVAFTHPAIYKRYRGYNGHNVTHDYNWFDAVRRPVHEPKKKCPYASHEPCDDNSHGTHCTGTICGVVDHPPAGVPKHIGVAPQANWIACRNMDHGVGRLSLYLSCLQFMLAPTNTDGNYPDSDRRPMVVSNSYGCPPSEQCEPDAMDHAVMSLRAAGVYMVVAAGNDGRKGCSTVNTPPGIYEDVLSIGAGSYKSKKITSFSSRGPVTVDHSGRVKPDVVAPGEKILSSVPPRDYRKMSGTSMATPHVAGMIALMWSSDSSLKRDVTFTTHLVEKNAETMPTMDCGTQYKWHNNIYGYGGVDALASIENK